MDNFSFFETLTTYMLDLSSYRGVSQDSWPEIWVDAKHFFSLEAQPFWDQSLCYLVWFSLWSSGLHWTFTNGRSLNYNNVSYRCNSFHSLFTNQLFSLHNARKCLERTSTRLEIKCDRLLNTTLSKIWNSWLPYQLTRGDWNFLFSGGKKNSVLFYSLSAP